MEVKTAKVVSTNKGKTLATAKKDVGGGKKVNTIVIEKKKVS